MKEHIGRGGWSPYFGSSTECSWQFLILFWNKQLNINKHKDGPCMDQWRKGAIDQGLWLIQCAAAKSLQSCLTLCDPIDGSPPGSAILGISRLRTLEWVAISFSSAWKWKVKVKLLSRVWLLATPWTAAYQAPLSMGFSRQENWSGVPLPSPNPVYLGLKKKKRWFTQGKWLIIKWYHYIDGKIICEGERTWQVMQMTKVGTLGRCRLPRVWLFPCMCRVEGNLEGEGNRLFYLLLSFNHARTVP